MHHVPVVLIVQALQLAVRAGAAQASHSAENKRAVMSTQLEALRITAQREQSHYQAALISQTIDALQQIENKKIESVYAVFEKLQDALKQSQDALVDERKEIARQKMEIPSTEEKKLIYLRQRETEIGNEIADIRRSGETLQRNFQAFALQTGSSFRFPALPPVY